MHRFSCYVFLILFLVACGQETPLTDGQPALAMADVDLKRVMAANKEPGNWFTAGRDLQQTYHSPLTQIHADNAGELGFAWQYETDTVNGLEATPLVIDGVLYTSGPWGVVYAVDARNGTELWRYNPQVAGKYGRRTCCDIVNRGVAVRRGKVYVGALDGRLIALDAKTGTPVWEVNTVVDPERMLTITGAPYIAKDMVVIGNSGAEFNARGYFTAYDLNTGALRWRFFTVPGDPSLPFEHEELEAAAKTWDPNSLWEVGGGGTVWDGMAYDAELNLLYVGTGNATPYLRKFRSPSGGDNLYLASILAINPDTGRLVWHYQTVPGENWDYAATQKMILADLEVDGRLRKVLMQAPKNGFFYVLDRVTGELLSAKPFVPVNWASHVDPHTGRPVETGQGEYFDEPKLIFPSQIGGHNWQPMAFNPATGLVYIPAMEAPMIFLNLARNGFKYNPNRMNVGGVGVFPDLDNPDKKSRFAGAPVPPLSGLTAGQPDPTMHGFLRAWDPVKQAVAWEIDTSGPWEGEFPAIWNGGGVLTTAGNLVIQGYATGELKVYTADTGTLLHAIDIGSSIMAAPMTYTVDGKQYVAVMAGYGGAVGLGFFPEGSAANKYGNSGRIVAFKLGGGPVPKRPPLVHDDVIPKPPEQNVSRKTKGQGAFLFAINCARCHQNNGPGVIPDLRYMSAETHAEFNAIVIEGTRAARGMAAFADVLTGEQADAIHAHLISLAQRAYKKQQAAGK